MIYYIVDECSGPNAPELEAVQRKTFSELGWNYDLALQRVNDLLHHNGRDDFQDSTRHVHSQHWIAFAALVDRRPRRILEIGTYTAHTTAFLSGIFPGAEITTIDLPDNSPTFCSSYFRESNEARAGFIQQRNLTLSQLPNVRFLQINSALLPAMRLDKFDIIWMDGGHDYPDVAWDMCNCLHLLSPGGILLCDDIYTQDKIPEYATRDAFHVIEMMAKENIISFKLIEKRLHQYYLENKIFRKYIAVVYSKIKKYISNDT